jgi:hypothetical protein
MWWPRENGQRVFLDILSVKIMKDTDKPTTQPYWRIMVNKRTELKFRDFCLTRDGMVKPTCEQHHRWKEAGPAVKYIHLGNGGENKALQKRAPGTTDDKSSPIITRVLL